MAKFNIIKEYLKKLEFTSPNTPSIFFDNDAQMSLSVNIDTDCAGSSENIFDVTVTVSLSTNIGEKEVFHLDVGYSGIVTINLLNDKDDEEKRRVLMVEVPQTLYPIVRDIIAQLTFRSGFPPVRLQHCDFEQNYLTKYNNNTVPMDVNVGNPDINTKTCELFSYETVVSKFIDTKEGEEFLQTCVAHGMIPDLAFEETPMFKYLMRFVAVPDFNVPLIEDVNFGFSFFETLYRMLVLDDNAKYRLGIDEVLELYVTYGAINDTPISKMSFDDLYSLVTSLIIDSWVKYNVPLSQLFPEKSQSKSDECIKRVDVKGMITYDEYVGLFENFIDTLVIDEVQVQNWYRKLQAIDISTIKYRF